MATRVLNDVGERRVIERKKFVNETRKDVILSKRGEARLYRANRTFLWAKSMGASTQATNSLVNLSYGVLQTINDVQALFSAGNFVRSVGARYAWTLGGRALSRIQSKIVPQGGGPIGRAMRVQAGRQSKKILSAMSSNFFVKTDIEIQNVVNMEKRIKHQLSAGKGIARKWSLLTAANAISNAPDPYTEAQKIMGKNSKKGLDKNMDGAFKSDQTFLKDSDVFANIFGQTTTVSEARHYQKYLTTGQNPNNLLTGYRTKIAEMDLAYDRHSTNGPTYIKSLKTGEIDYQKNLVNRVNEMKTQSVNEYNPVKPSDENIHGLDMTKSQDRKIMNMIQQLGPYNEGLDADDFEQLLNSGHSYTKNFNAFFDLTHALNSLSRLRQQSPQKPLTKMRQVIAASAHQGDKSSRAFIEMARKISQEQYYNSSTAGSLIDKVLGTKGFGMTYREMLHVETGNLGIPPKDMFKNGKLNPIYEGVGYKLYKSSNNPKDPNYIPSRDQIQRAIHIEPEQFKLKDAFMRVSVGFGGKSPQSRFADFIGDAQEIEFGGVQKTRGGKSATKDKNQFKHTYPRTLFMHNAAYKAAKQLGINFGMTKPKVTKHTIGSRTFSGEIHNRDMLPKEKQKAFNLMLDRRTRELLDAEIDVRRKIGTTGRVSMKDSYETVLFDPQGTRYDTPQLRNRELVRESVLKITSPMNRRTSIVMGDDGQPKLIYEDVESVGGAGFQNYFDRVNKAMREGSEIKASIVADQIWQRQFRANLNEVLGAVGVDMGGLDETQWYTRFPADVSRRAGVTSVDDVITNIEMNVNKARQNYIENAQLQSDDRLKKNRAKREQDAKDFAVNNNQSGGGIEMETLFRNKLRELEEAAEIEEFLTVTNQLKDFPYEEVWEEMENQELDRLRNLFSQTSAARRGRGALVDGKKISFRKFSEDFSDSINREIDTTLQKIADEQYNGSIETAKTSIEYEQAKDNIINEYKIFADSAGVNFEVYDADDLSNVILTKVDPATGETQEFLASFEELARTDIADLETKYVPIQKELARGINVEGELDTSQGAYGSTTQNTGVFGDPTFEESMKRLEQSETLRKATKSALNIIRNIRPKRTKGMPTFGGGLGVVAVGDEFLGLTPELKRPKVSISSNENRELRDALGLIAGEIQEDPVNGPVALGMYLWGWKSGIGQSTHVAILLGAIKGSFQDYSLPAGQEFIGSGIASLIENTIIPEVNRIGGTAEARAITQYLQNKNMVF